MEQLSTLCTVSLILEFKQTSSSSHNDSCAVDFKEQSSLGVKLHAMPACKDNATCCIYNRKITTTIIWVRTRASRHSGQTSVFTRIFLRSHVTTDRRRQLESQFFSEFTKLTGIKHFRTTANPLANGLVKRFHRQVKSEIMCHETEKWVDVLPIILSGIRSAWKEDLQITFPTIQRIPCSTSSNQQRIRLCERSEKSLFHPQTKEWSQPTGRQKNHILTSKRRHYYVDWPSQGELNLHGRSSTIWCALAFVAGIACIVLGRRPINIERTRSCVTVVPAKPRRWRRNVDGLLSPSSLCSRRRHVFCSWDVLNWRISSVLNLSYLFSAGRLQMMSRTSFAYRGSRFEIKKLYFTLSDENLLTSKED